MTLCLAPRLTPTPFTVALDALVIVTVIVTVTLSPGTAIPSNKSRNTAQLTPNVYRLVHAALSKAGLDRETPKRLSSRVKWAATLPKISARAGHSRGRADFLDLVAGKPDQLDTNTRSRTNIEVRLTWDLSRLFFETREIDVARMRRAHERERRQLTRQIVDLYYEYQHLSRQRTPPIPQGSTADHSMKRDCRCARIAALIEHLSGLRLTLSRCGRRCI